MTIVTDSDEQTRIAAMIERLIEMLRVKTGKPDAEWSAATTLEDAGLDPFDVVECIFQLEEEMHVSIDFNANNESKVSTIGEFAAGRGPQHVNRECPASQERGRQLIEVAVTGVGVVSPCGANLTDYWQAVEQGTPNFTPRELPSGKVMTVGSVNDDGYLQVEPPAALGTA